LPVAFLGAEATRRDHDHALIRHPPPGDPAQSRPHGFVEARRMPGIEAQLDGARDLVDILPARPAGADKALLALALRDGNAPGRKDHPARQPLMQMTGCRTATLRERPATWAASTTAVLSL